MHTMSVVGEGHRGRALLTKMNQGKGAAVPRADTGGSGHGQWKRHWALLQEHYNVNGTGPGHWTRAQ